MPIQIAKSGPAGMLLGFTSAAFLMLALTAHPQESSSSGASSPAAPQSGQSTTGESASGASSSESGKTGTGKLSRADEKLVMEAAQANIAEINAGKLAQQKSQNDEVKNFAQKMVDDHTKALDDLKKIADAKGVTLPTEPNREQKSMENKLSALSGDKFDKQYIDQAGKRAHRDTHRLLQRMSSRASDAELKSYAKNVMSTVEDHQQLAKDTSDSLSTSAGKSGAGSTESGGSSSGSSNESKDKSSGESERK